MVSVSQPYPSFDVTLIPGLASAATTAYSAHGYGANAVKYNGWRIVDRGIGYYTLTFPHTSPGSYAVDLYLSSAGCDYRGLSGSGCSRSQFEKVDIVVQAAGVSALGTTGAVQCQPGPPGTACWLTAGMPVLVSVTSRDRFGNPTLRSGDAAKLGVSVCTLATSGAAAAVNNGTSAAVAFTGCLTNSSTTRAAAAGSTEAVKYTGAAVSEVTATAGRHKFRLSFDVASII